MKTDSSNELLLLLFFIDHERSRCTLIFLVKFVFFNIMCLRYEETQLEMLIVKSKKPRASIMFTVFIIFVDILLMNFYLFLMNDYHGFSNKITNSRQNCSSSYWPEFNYDFVMKILYIEYVIKRNSYRIKTIHSLRPCANWDIRR